MELDWVRDIRDRCRSAGVALFVKQMGSAWARGRTKGNDMDRWPPDLRIREMPHQGGGQRCVG
jgi:protein gp37